LLGAAEEESGSWRERERLVRVNDMQGSPKEGALGEGSTSHGSSAGRRGGATLEEECLFFLESAAAALSNKELSNARYRGEARRRLPKQCSLRAPGK